MPTFNFFVKTVSYRPMSKKMDFTLPELMLRNSKNIFSVKDIKDLLSKMGLKLTLRETRAFIESSPYIFILEDGMYMSRSAAFSYEFFSIKPSAFEFSKRVFFSGDRCMPFADVEVHPADFDFYYKNKKLKTKAIEVDSDFAIDLYMLFGEEYASQYIAADPANKNEIDLTQTNYTLPVNVKLTAFDLKPLIDDGFTKNDRLLCYVESWGECKICVDFEHDNTDNIFDSGLIGKQRSDWYIKLENYLLESFELIGPCATIEEQLANVFFEHRLELCQKNCGSVEEMLKISKKVALESFGVETRLWKKGEVVPAFGNWSDVNLDSAEVKNARKIDEKLTLKNIPDSVIDQYILDMFFRKENDLSLVKNRIFKNAQNFTSVEEESILLQLKERSAILRKSYNWFADQRLGPVRQSALLLYTDVFMLVHKIDVMEGSYDSLPQQELVILLQLFTHLSQMVENFFAGDCSEKDAESLAISIEGMQYNFEDIAGRLESAIEDQYIKKFTVIK